VFRIRKLKVNRNMQIKYLILLEDLHTMNSTTNLAQKIMDITHNWKDYIHRK